MNKNIKEILPYVIVIIIILVIKAFFFSTIKVNGTSMLDTLKPNDVMILNKIGTKTSSIKRFDIVVVKTPNDKLIKRVIGLPGETLEYKDNILYINGEVLEDKYNNGQTPDIEEIKLEDNEYIVLGDNRGISLDSSEFGPIVRNQIVGKTSFTIWPLNRFGNK